MMRRYFYLIISLIYILVSCDEEPVISKKEIIIDIETEFSLDTVDAFRRQVTFINNTDTSGTPLPLTFLWTWGDGSKTRSPEENPITHTFPQSDTAFVINLKLIKNEDQSIVSEFDRTLDFDNYPIEEPYTVNFLASDIGTWNSRINWEVINSNNNEVPKTYLTLSRDSSFTEIIDIFNGELSDANPQERNLIDNQSQFVFHHLKANTKYFVKLEIEKEEGLSSFRKDEFETNMINLPTLTVNNEENHGYFTVISTLQNHFLDSIAPQSEKIVTFSPDLPLIHSNGDTSIYAKMFTEEIIISCYEKTLHRILNDSSDIVSITINESHKDIYHTYSGTLQALNSGDVGAQIYFYQDRYRLFIGQRNQVATFQSEGIHINLGTSLPHAETYFYLNSTNTKLRDNSLNADISLFGEQGVSAFRMYIYSVEGEQITMGINNITDDLEKKFRIIFKDPSVDSNYRASIDQLLFRTITITD